MTGDLKFFKELWKSVQPNCEECGAYINDPAIHNFAHILPKSHYPAFRHNPQNIIILCLKHHQQLDFGRKDTLKIWPQLQQKITELKSQYHKNP